MVESGAVKTLIGVVNTPYWPPTLREAAAGFLMHLAEEWPNIERSLGGTEEIQKAMVELIKTKTPLLEMRAARYLGRMTFSTPYLQPKPRGAMAGVKHNISKLDGITQLVKLLIRCHKRYTILLASPNGFNFRPRRISDAEDDKSNQFEKDCNNLGVSDPRGPPDPSTRSSGPGGGKEGGGIREPTSGPVGIERGCKEGVWRTEMVFGRSCEGSGRGQTGRGVTGRASEGWRRGQVKGRGGNRGMVVKDGEGICKGMCRPSGGWEGMGTKEPSKGSCRGKRSRGWGAEGRFANLRCHPPAPHRRCWSATTTPCAPS